MEPRIVLIGAGSSQFGYNMVLDAVNLEALRDCSLVLHDLDAGKLESMGNLANRMIREADSSISVEWTAERSEALDGADFVVLSEDPRTVPPDSIKDIRVEMTVIGGEVVHGD